MSKLSPAARSVFESFNSKFEWVEDGVPGPQFKAIAAALRAAVDEVAPDKTIEEIDCVDQSFVEGYRDALYEILILANELEASFYSAPPRLASSGKADRASREGNDNQSDNQATQRIR